ncbi:Protein of unknown function [Planifilum fulgidum]|jgi:hypothetical protein|uniref:DUF2953 domain-containing protein n=1 Tax=Planifilum fulgidum TaxID=201973 RepID=A0A1I2L855_9BACL|nr:DUF2953 domain-containing protein [Planifilum fulgidum]SFF74669.1 Protein of unknown function [Planifilum fulgidum]
MQVLGWIFFTLLFLLLLIPFTTLSIRFQYRREGDDDELGVTVRWIGGLVRFHYSVPLIKREDEGLAVRQKLQTGKGKTLTGKRRRITLETVGRYQRRFQSLKRRVRDLNDTIRLFLRHVTCERLEWATTIGTGDAAETGVLTGMAWAIKTALVQAVGRHVRWARPPALDVRPSFGERRLQSHLLCIVRFRLGHLILAVTRLYLNMRKGSEGTWRNTPFRA